MSQIVLIGQDWKTRALLRAELLEAGLDVEAYETIEDARAAVEQSYPPPKLLIADLTSSLHPLAIIALLAAWTHQIRVWVIASRSVVSEGVLAGHGFERVLFRPVDLGRLVLDIERALA